MNWNVGFKAGYHACLVDPVTWQDTERFNLTEGSINRTDSGLRESADLTAVDYSYGMDKWIRIYLDAEQDGDSAHIPLFTGLTSTPEEEIDGVIHRTSIQCYSVLKPAQDMMLSIGWFAEKGFICTEIIDSLLSVCPAPVVVEQGSPRLVQHYVAEKDESNLTMIYKLLDAIGWRLRIEGDGTIHVEPKPTEPTITLAAGSYGLIKPKVNRANDAFDCPNVFRAVSESIAAIAYDTDADSVLSIENRGREVWAQETGCATTDGETLMLYAKRKLRELQRYSLSISYDRTFEPLLNVTDKVALRYPSTGIDGIYTVTSQKISLDHCGTTSEEVTA